jgi:ribosome biogenesis GTPase
MVGTILRAQSGFFWVQTPEGVFECRLRGRLKKERQSSDIAVIGDQVEVTPISATVGAIEAVLPRRTHLARRAPGPKGVWKEDVLVANVDLVVLVFSCDQPEFHSRMLDRYLVLIEHNQLDVLIAATKTDLVSAEAAQTLFAPYEQIGYPVIYTSTTNQLGIDQLRQHLIGRLSVVTGKSGVGKSSLLNALQPNLALATGAISSALNKGRHTTVVAELIPLEGEPDSYVADTPGIREIGLWRFPLDELDWCFREFRPYLGECYFTGCTHTHEPDCAVLQAFEQGLINRQRYESYLRLREDA